MLKIKIKEWNETMEECVFTFCSVVTVWLLRITKGSVTFDLEITRRVQKVELKNKQTNTKYLHIGIKMTNVILYKRNVGM